MEHDIFSTGQTLQFSNDATLDKHRAIASLMEELEAIDGYEQRVDAADDEELRAILAHNRDEEREHAAMILEWLRRRNIRLDAPRIQPGTRSHRSGTEASVANEIRMATRIAHARWQGAIKEGNGVVDFGNRLFKGAYSFTSRFESGAGTNPEELLGAAHASCFAMALSLMLGEAGMKPDYIDATAHVTVGPQDGGFRITGSHLVCEARVPGIDEATFARYAEKAKAGCPVSQALAGTEITLETKLRQE